ncbi:AAA family ATPase [Rhabdothermincola sp.]|uniref:AAA family ATPase n=1 Tax=Rhabdothermincola sp. TaxID=2820405 RepID=UPI002FE1296F
MAFGDHGGETLHQPQTIDLRAPRTIEELGIPLALVQDLILRRALFEGRTSTLQLATALGLSVAVTSKVIEDLRELRHLEVLGLDGFDYQLELTQQGRDAAMERMQLCRYAGAAPVALDQYVQVVRAQSAQPVVTRESMQHAFADLVVSDWLLDELGPALLTPGAIFLYGPPGTGKTSLAERLIRVHGDHVFIPRAVEVDSQIITVYDPVVHEAVPEQPAELDPRWVLCRRPSVIAGGELTTSMMDLTYESSNGVYLAPIQMQANNGLLIIDDFGRQSMTPEQLLNRWIVPLDRRVDYLSLAYGVRFEIPFDVKVVFSTNLEPASLGDEAFFRRIQNKILVPSIDDAEFDVVLRSAAARYGIAIEPGAEEYLREVSRRHGDGDLRPYLPHEVCKILRAVCAYRGEPPVLDRGNVDRVVGIYFTHATRERAASSGNGHPGAPGGPQPPPMTTLPALSASDAVR